MRYLASDHSCYSHQTFNYGLLGCKCVYASKNDEEEIHVVYILVKNHDIT